MTAVAFFMHYLAPAAGDGSAVPELLPGGGGTTFEGYATGDYSLGMVRQGTGISEVYVGDSPFGYVCGDEFSDYPEGAYAGGAPGATAAGFTAIFVGNGP